MNDDGPTFKLVNGGEFHSHLDTTQVNELVFGKEYATVEGPDFGGQNLYRAWFERNPDIYMFLVSGERVIGYANAMPLEESAFQEVLQGQLDDGTLDPARIRTYDQPGIYKLYLCAIAVLPEYRSSIGLWWLHTMFKQKVDAWNQRGIFFGELAAVAWTDRGRLLCRALGMTYLRPHCRQGDVYHGVLPEGRWPDRLT